MLRFLKRIARRLGLVKLASGGEVRETVHIDLRPAFEANSDAIRQLFGEQVRRSIATQRRGPTPGLRRVVALHKASITKAPDCLQLAAQDLAAAVIDALQNG